MTEIITRYFTFGGGHVHPVTGESLRMRYVKIPGRSIDECRRLMFDQFGRNWSMEYASAKKAGVDRFGLQELTPNQWPIPGGFEVSLGSTDSKTTTWANEWATDWRTPDAH